jgi:hypothetical protein
MVKKIKEMFGIISSILLIFSAMLDPRITIFLCFILILVYFIIIRRYKNE